MGNKDYLWQTLENCVWYWTPLSFNNGNSNNKVGKDMDREYGETFKRISQKWIEDNEIYSVREWQWANELTGFLLKAGQGKQTWSEQCNKETAQIFMGQILGGNMSRKLYLEVFFSKIGISKEVQRWTWEKAQQPDLFGQTEYLWAPCMMDENGKLAGHLKFLRISFWC
jgi:hypothetical protein